MGFFCVLAVARSAATNTGVRGSLQTTVFLFGGCVPTTGIAGSSDGSVPPIYLFIYLFIYLLTYF